MKSLLACGLDHIENFALSHSENDMQCMFRFHVAKKRKTCRKNKQSERPHWIGHCKMQKAPEVRRTKFYLVDVGVEQMKCTYHISKSTSCLFYQAEARQ